MSQTITAEAAWPPAPPNGSVVVAHPAWEAARTVVLDRASEGPVTIALIGPPGSGKTWLLRELAACLGEHGFPTMMIMQGDLPVLLIDNAAVLVDEALLMPEANLDELCTQDRAVVVLADIEAFGEAASLRPTQPVIVSLRNLTDNEVHAFAAEWWRQPGLSPAELPAAALARLVVHGRGSVRLIVQLLEAVVVASKLSGQKTLDAADIDRAAAMLTGDTGIEAKSPASSPESVLPAAPPRRAAHRRKILAASALAACVALGWAVWTGFSLPADNRPASDMAALPPLRPAETNSPALATRSAPLPATVASIESAHPAAAETPAVEPPATVPLPPAEMAGPIPSSAAALPPAPLASTDETAVSPAPPIAAAEPAPARIAAAPAPTRVVPEPTPPGLVAEPAPARAVTEPAAPTARRGAPGIVLLAQRGDTLDSLYRRLYRDRTAPPYADVVAANPNPLKPGAIVVFPAPPGGWSTPAAAEPATSERGQPLP